MRATVGAEGFATYVLGGRPTTQCDADPRAGFGPLLQVSGSSDAARFMLGALGGSDVQLGRGNPSTIFPLSAEIGAIYRTEAHRGFGLHLGGVLGAPAVPQFFFHEEVLLHELSAGVLARPLGTFGDTCGPIGFGQEDRHDHGI